MGTHNYKKNSDTATYPATGIGKQHHTTEEWLEEVLQDYNHGGHIFPAEDPKKYTNYSEMTVSKSRSDHRKIWQRGSNGSICPFY